MNRSHMVVPRTHFYFAAGGCCDRPHHADDMRLQRIALSTSSCRSRFDALRETTSALSARQENHDGMVM